MLPCVRGGLLTYAVEHQGWYPNGTNDPYGALTALFPSYCNAWELAGVSGRIHEAKKALEQQGEPLTEKNTSWVYVPGFHYDDPKEVAILWERKAGFYWNGRRNFFGGRPVLFVDGSISNVPASNWETFMSSQEQLRRSVIAAGAARATNMSDLVDDGPGWRATDVHR